MSDENQIVNETENQIMNVEEGSLISQITERKKTSYSSFVPTTEEEKINVYNALQTCDARVSDILNTEITIKNIICQEYEKIDNETGEVKQRVRTIIFDENGKSYGTASKGIYYSIIRLIQAFGEPKDWKEPKHVMIKEQTTRNGGKTYIIEVLKH